jgi:hypothetical protein
MIGRRRNDPARPTPGALWSRGASDLTGPRSVEESAVPYDANHPHAPSQPGTDAAECAAIESAVAVHLPAAGRARSFVV